MHDYTYMVRVTVAIILIVIGMQTLRSMFFNVTAARPFWLKVWFSVFGAVSAAPLLLLLVMSVDPLRVLVRRLRAAAAAEDAQLSAAFAALPHEDLLRVYYFCRDAVREARETGMGYDTDGSSEFDLPGLESLAGRSQPFFYSG